MKRLRGWPRLKGDSEGRFVRLLRSITTNGGVKFAAGEVMEIHRNWRGLELKATTNCQTCEREFRHTVKRVSEFDVELLPKDYKLGKEKGDGRSKS